MFRIIQITVLGLMLAGLLGGAFGTSGSAEAAGGNEQWTGPHNDGCYYFWDGYAFKLGLCPQVDGRIDYYVPDSNGQWAYWYSEGYDSKGVYYIYYHGQYYYPYVVDQTSTLQCDLTTIVGCSTFSDAVTVQTSSGQMIIGGGMWSIDSSGTIVANEIISDSNHRTTTNILSPNCVEVVAGVCYTY